MAVVEERAVRQIMEDLKLRNTHMTKHKQQRKILGGNELVLQLKIKGQDKEQVKTFR